jgi:hypothetical protein
MPHTARHGGDDDGRWSGNEDGNDGNASDGGGTFTLPTVLSTFASNPRRFIIGAVLTTIVNGLFDIAAVAIQGIQIATDALASVPTQVADTLTDAGATIGTDIYQLVVTFNDPLFNAADTAGPLAPVLVALVVVTETAIVLVIGERAIRVVIDVIPGGGGLV